VRVILLFLFTVTLTVMTSTLLVIIPGIVWMSKHHAVMQGMWSYLRTFWIVTLSRGERLPKYMLGPLALLSAVHFK